jgi:subtilase family serine protease
MSFSPRRIALLSCMFLSVVSLAAQSKQADRVVAAVDAGTMVRLAGQVPSWANGANDAGAVDAGLQLEHLTMILSRSPEREQAFQQLLLDQQNPSSPRYHQWITPVQSGELYGATKGDRAAVTAWLTAQGLRVDDVSTTGIFITFSGPASAVGRALATEFHSFRSTAGVRYATTAEPSVPATLVPVVQSFLGLSEGYFHNHLQVTAGTLPATAGGVHPEFTNGTYHFLTPKDFATIYDINSTYSAGITGSGQHVLVLGASRVLAADVSLYETYTSQAQYQPNVVILPTGGDPGYTSDSSQAEATLDVDRVIGTAPGAPVDLFLSTNQLAFSTTATMLNYEVSTLNDPIVSMSFGACEANAGTYTRGLDSIFAAGAAQGISFFASSGDSGAAGCETSFAAAPSVQTLGADFICASSYVTCVGGTEFADTGNPGLYWGTVNSTGLSSALSYIPEGAWNEPLSSTGSYEVAGTGGGVSTVIAKPVWQVGIGVPTDGFRDTPDLSFSASIHNGYFGCLAYASESCAGTGSVPIAIFGGTSASTPSMAGIMALVNQKLGARQGNFNPTIYRLAGTTGNGVFHDATVASSGVGTCVATTPSLCNNSTPGPATLTGGLAGSMLTTGYDQATGWGSIDVGNLLTAVSKVVTQAPGFTITATPASLTLSAGAAAGNTSTLTYTSLSGLGGTITQTCSVAYTGAGSNNYLPTCSFTAATVTLPAGGTVMGTITIGSTVPHAVAGGSTLAGLGFKQSLGGLALGMLLMAFVPWRRGGIRGRAVWRIASAVFALGLGLTAVTGCGSAGTNALAAPTTVPVGTTAGTYTVTISSPLGTTAATSATSILLTIQ